MSEYKIFTSRAEIFSAICTTYGIEALDENGKVLAKVEDISTNEAAVKHLAEKCQRLDLAPYQLLDVARDFVIDESRADVSKKIFRVIASLSEIDGVNHTVYGIEAVDENGKILAKVEDISTNEAAVKHLAEKCQRLGLAPYQLLDVARDFVNTIS